MPTPQRTHILRLTGHDSSATGNLCSNDLYTYDAESRLTSAGGVNYFYDGDGNRVEKSDGTLYWGSGPLAESDLNGGNWTDYIFFNGKRVARIDPGGLAGPSIFVPSLQEAAPPFAILFSP